MKIGDMVYVHGYVDEIRKDTVIIRNDGGYFGTIPNEIVMSGLVMCRDCKWWDVSPSSTSAPAFHRCRGFEKHHTKADEFCSRAERREDEE